MELIASNDAGTVTRWSDNAGPNLVTTPIAPYVTNVIPTADGRRALVRVEPGYLEVRGLADLTRPGVRISAPPGINEATSVPIAISGDGSRAMSYAGSSGGYLVADGETGELLWNAENTPTSIADLSPDGNTVVASTDEAEPAVALIEVATGSVQARRDIADLSGDSEAGFVDLISYDPDGSFVYVGYEGGIARLGAADLTLQGSVAVDLPLSSNLIRVPGTDDVVVAGASGVVGRWDMESGDEVVKGRSPDPSVITGIALSPDGAVLAAYHGLTYELVLFDAQSLTPLGPPMPVGDFIFEPAFDPNDGSLLTNGLFQSVTRTTMDPQRWASQACAAAGRNLTRQEWADLVGEGEPYQATCPQWPAGE
jgi:WD40 repeat protein